MNNTKIVRIAHIADKNNTPRVDDKSLKRLNQRVILSLNNLVKGFRLQLEYIDRDGTLLLSEVQNIEEDEYGFWIETENSNYRLNYEEVNDDE